MDLLGGQMKFKPIYLYGIIIIAATIILLVVSQDNSTEQNQVTFDQNQQMPNDDVHKQLMNQSNSPSKENLSAEYKERMTKLKDAVERNAKDTVALKEYADFLSASHKMNEAIPYYEQILDIDPKRTDIHFTLAVVYYNKQDLVKCEEQNKKVLAYDPQNQMAIYNLGAIAATKGEVEKAKGFWNQVININSDSETGKLAKESLSKL
jgi:tetratricopeptide (TPR) repeat protein